MKSLEGLRDPQGSLGSVPEFLSLQHGIKELRFGPLQRPWDGETKLHTVLVATAEGRKESIRSAVRTARWRQSTPRSIPPGPVSQVPPDKLRFSLPRAQ